MARFTAPPKIPVAVRRCFKDRLRILFRMPKGAQHWALHAQGTFPCHQPPLTIGTACPPPFTCPLIYARLPLMPLAAFPPYFAAGMRRDSIRPQGQVSFFVPFKGNVWILALQAGLGCQDPVAAIGTAGFMGSPVRYPNTKFPVAIRADPQHRFRRPRKDHIRCLRVVGTPLSRKRRIQHRKGPQLAVVAVHLFNFPVIAHMICRDFLTGKIFYHKFSKLI